ncbi:hypothetical protein BN1058_00596 [Paraliobacillus sp. PM-2]|uniref:polysaccharide deacetylase family protein n=1 Tax=Paraliobacillus sp. PM-2 TaxID=1462524 RepID=UPI00061BC472|nr:polysaccharide deacetylase family protein [Paraliobacillus sp. PM-2]CQR46341.1 hypothetical protein BN1058_00596 [Paraliobacillus sp. PM-2]
MGKHWKPIICVVLLGIIFIESSIHVIHAKKLSSTPAVLVVGKFDGEKGHVNQRKLDLLISHFTTNIVFKSIKEVKGNDFQDRTHVVYFDDQLATIPNDFVELLSDFHGTVLAIGENVAQLGERFAFIKQNEKRNINQIYLATDKAETLSIQKQSIINIETSKEVKTWLFGKGDSSKEYPLLIQNESIFYLAITTIEMPVATLIGEVLHEVFSVDHPHEYQGYIRLEDVHPLVEVDKLMKIAQLLKERKIPYMVAVIPVYIHPQTKEKYHLSDSPELLNALSFIQNNGGSIVLHGYTHQFRDSETGEGFEFWDVEHNMPIYHGVKETPEKKGIDDFAKREDYDIYLREKQKIETTYIEKKLTKGINELANYRLYPLAFEAPHYTMSQNGYQITSQFFSTYVGQLQLSDQNWQKMMGAPYITNPQFLNGMTLLPETIGYMEQASFSLQKMRKAIKSQMMVRDGMVAGFYHPYLGVEGFKEMLTLLEHVPNMKWIDLKQMDNEVATSHVTIQSNDGEMHTGIDYLKLFQSDKRYLIYHIKKLPQVLLWIFIGIGSCAVCLFIYYILLNKHQQRSRYHSYRRK